MDPDDVPTKTGSASALPAQRLADDVSFHALQVRDPRRYHIIGEHGRGGLGRVSRARDTELGRDIAIKELIVHDRTGEVRFLREALITARLEHPSIVPVHEAGRWPDGKPYYAMKLVAGRSLKELIADCQTAADRLRLLDHVIAVAEAMAYAHDRRIIHRDLKPANVIVGDFGETIVIDWGLAKELGDHEGSAAAGDPYRDPPLEGITVAGAILGTPMYMAPEQARGDDADERADVFAIGAMLWELCAVERMLPSEPAQRARILRRAHIDKDLAAILVKAVAADRELRYRSARDLAADLRAFKAGARIAARHYSLFALLSHWVGRHRALAISLASITGITIAFAVAYFHNIALERDRADAALVVARSQRADAIVARDALTLRHAELLLHTDPSAAMELLAAYRGADVTAHAVLQARARSLGVAHLKAAAHAGRVLFVHDLPDGSLLSMGGQTIARTSPDGVSRVIARGVIPQRDGSYARTRGLLAFPCDASMLCVLDTRTEQVLPLLQDRIPPFVPNSLEFSPDEQLLAAIGGAGQVVIWQLPQHGSATATDHVDVPHGQALRFVANDELAIITELGLQLLKVSERGQLTQLRFVPVPHVTDLAVHRDRERFVAGTRDGTLRYGDAGGAQVSTIAVCKGAVNSVGFLQDADAVIVACQDGDAGVWRVTARGYAARVHLDGGAAVVNASADDRYLFVGGSSGKVLIYDLVSKLVSSRLGSDTWITFLYPPTPTFPYLVSGDGAGTVRAWPMPSASSQVAIKGAARMTDVTSLATDASIVATAAESNLHWKPAGSPEILLKGHATQHVAIATHPKAAAVALFFADSIVELWSLTEHPAHREIDTKQGIVVSAAYRSDGKSLVTAGQDGSVIAWDEDGRQRTTVGSLREPLHSMSLVPGTDQVVVRSTRGEVWLLDGRSNQRIAADAGPLSAQVVSPDARWLAVGSQTGEVRVYSLCDPTRDATMHVGSRINAMAFSNHGSQLSIGADRDTYVVDLAPGPGPCAAPRFVAPVKQLGIKVESMTYSTDDAWLGMTAVDGALWFYARALDQWFCETVSGGELFAGAFTADGRRFLSLDSDGDVLVTELSSLGARTQVDSALRKNP